MNPFKFAIERVFCFWGLKTYFCLIKTNNALQNSLHFFLVSQ